MDILQPDEMAEFMEFEFLLDEESEILIFIVCTIICFALLRVIVNYCY